MTLGASGKKPRSAGTAGEKVAQAWEKIRGARPLKALKRRSAPPLRDAPIGTPLEERAQHMNHRQDASAFFLLAVVAHELKTPLTSLLLQAQVLKGEVDVQSLARAAAGIERLVRQQTRLIDDLLDISRINAGKLRLELLPVDLSWIARESMETVRLSALEKQLDLRCDVAGFLPSIEGDAFRLQQVVSNLLTNAIKFTPSRGTIRISAELLPNSIRLSICDTGRGIAPEALSHVFEPFWQVDPGKARNTQGLGLGLAIAHEIVELHGGLLEVWSAGPGEGTTFTMTLPRVKPLILPRPEQFLPSIDRTPVHTA
jgi:signal transduction histidine kinase